ncbi:peptide-binding protein [Floricoccus tropicus]|uniref:Peptide-binding protein n=1 Tax=Floricoccus tropicus TaxID=1859473 RepID=A0A1E8GLV9_9LACT|nr:ABC transporter substrate-binding protein [Floricoccus tropicus]OFI49239.1 peptide-binding protein [Floricoccus tropicus]
MSKVVKRVLGVAAVTTVALGLGACSSSSSSDKGTDKKDSKDEKVGDFNVSYANPDKAIEGGDLTYGYIAETPFIGQWLSPLSTDAIDSKVQSPAFAPVFAIDSSFTIQNGKDKGGLADIEFDKDKKTALVTLHDGVKWSDGQAITARDLYYPYEIIANDKAKSTRWTDSLANIEGLEDYHNNKTDKISGLTFPDGEDGKKLLIQFKENKPGFTQSGNGYFLETIAPYHYLKDVPFEKLVSDEKTTTKPLVAGPFKPVKIVPGESIRYEVNENYSGPKPKLKSVTVKTVTPAKAVAALKAQEFDILDGTTNDLYPEVKKLTSKGYEILGQQDLYVSLLYYNVGHYDKEKSVNVSDRETPVQDPKVRQALSYALNTDQINETLNNGLNTRAIGTIPPVFKDYASKGDGFPLDLDKANKLLDEAGWKLDKDAKGKDGKTNDASDKGYRVKDGKTLSLTFMARSGQATSEPIAQSYINQWKQIGVDVSLYNNKLTDFNSWGDIVQSSGKTKENQSWDITQGAWSLSSEPSQQDLFSASAPFNFGHFTSDELTKDLNDIDSEKAMDPEYRKKAFQKYQDYLQETAFVTPLSFKIVWTPVNKRVQNFTLDYGENELWAKLAVTSDKPSDK